MHMQVTCQSSVKSGLCNVLLHVPYASHILAIAQLQPGAVVWSLGMYSLVTRGECYTHHLSERVGDLG